MIIYLSGPISARLDTYQDHFQKVYDKLTAAGHAVISPHFLPIGLKKEQDYLNIAHENLKAAEAIYLLDGWHKSPGALTELKWAVDMKKQIFLESDKESNLFLDAPSPVEI